MRSVTARSGNGSTLARHQPRAIGFFKVPDASPLPPRTTTTKAVNTKYEPMSRTSSRRCAAPPGADASDTYNDFAFALPANAGYLQRKLPLARERLGQAATIWDEA